MRPFRVHVSWIEIGFLFFFYDFENGFGEGVFVTPLPSRLLYELFDNHSPGWQDEELPTLEVSRNFDSI